MCNNRIYYLSLNLLRGYKLLAVLGRIQLQPLVAQLLHKIHDVALHQPLGNLLRLRSGKAGKKLCDIIHS
jgi:hypothetical protein